MMIAKDDLRKKYKIARSQLAITEIEKLSANICKNIINNIFSKITINNKIIAIYQPINNEVKLDELTKFLIKQNCQLALPVINHQKDILEFAKFDKSIKLTNNKKYKNILEPDSNEFVFPNIIIVPLLCFDKNLNRVGYGKGFYDKTIKHLKYKTNPLTIGVAYNLQFSNEAILTDNFDQKLNFITTENNIFCLN